MQLRYRTIKKFVLVLISAIVLTGCSGLVGKGNKLYEQGLYHEAAMVYEKVLLRDPSNVEASVGLKNARTMIIDRGLIEVRMLRVASNRSGAAQKLEEVLRNQELWDIAIQGPVAMTQAEETRHAEHWLRDEAKSLSASPQPDKFKWFLERYAYLIENAQLGPAFAPYLETLRPLGQARCKTLTATVSGQRFYLESFVKQYCLNWGSGVTLNVEPTDHTRYSALLTNHNVSVDTPSDGGQRAILNNKLTSLERQFKQSLWYSPIGDSTLAIRIAGNITYDKSSHTEERSKEYSVPREVKKEDGTVEVIEVAKHYKYTATIYNETYRVKLNYSPKQALAVKHIINETKTNRTERHSAHNKQAKVYPEHPDYMNIDHELTAILVASNQRFNQNLQALWIEQYCGQHLGSDGGEKVLRCGKAQPENSYVNEWFEQGFGVNYRGMAQLYGL